MDAIELELPDEALNSETFDLLNFLMENSLFNGNQSRLSCLLH